MSGAGVFFLILFLILAAYLAWLGFKFFTLRKRGEKLVGWQSYVPFMKSSSSSSTNYPTPRSSGPLEWIKDKFDSLRNKRSQSGGYEDNRGDAGAYQGLNSGTARGRGRGGLEDDAWDDRVGGRHDDPYGHGLGPGGYNEEAELGLAPTPGPTTAAGYGGYGGDYMSQQTSYGGGGSSRARDDHLDPFSDAHQAPSTRSMSPRPELDGLDTRGHKKNAEGDDAGNTSPISTRKSVFREDVS